MILTLCLDYRVMCRQKLWVKIVPLSVAICRLLIYHFAILPTIRRPTFDRPVAIQHLKNYLNFNQLPLIEPFCEINTFRI